MEASNHLTIVAPTAVATTETLKPLPALFSQFQSPEQTAWDDYFRGMIENAHTRIAYERAVRRFFSLLPAGVGLNKITPGLIGGYMTTLAKHSIPTRKLHLAALRAFFDLLVQRHIMVINPAASVRGPRYQAVEGRTPEISIDQVRRLIAAIHVDTTDNEGEIISLAVGLRDRAIIGVMFYTAVRAGAVAKLTHTSICTDGIEHWLRLAEKGNKSREIPVRLDLWRWITEYIAVAPTVVPGGPLFRTALRRTGQLTHTAMTNVDICRMVKRRCGDAGLRSDLSPHSFRVATITDLLNNGAALEDVQFLAGHADPRTTRLYDRRLRKVTRNLVERISSLA